MGLRYYFDAQYGAGGEAMFQRSDSAYERALTLDPNLILAATQIVANRTERGNLLDSYAEALALVNRFPDSSQAHFTLSYVLRYAGLLDEAARECDTALSLDRTDSRLRSCVWPFAWLGQYQKAMKFLELDRGSEWVGRVTPFILLTQGKSAEARESVNHMPPGVAFGRDFLQVCLNPASDNRLDSAAKDYESAVGSEPDPERRYLAGTLLSYCGLQDAAARMISSAVQKNYCAYTALQRDPLLAKLRESPQFAQLLANAKACQADFLAKRARTVP